MKNQMLTEREGLDMLDEMLDDCNEPYRLGYLEFSPSEILKKLDPVAYREEAINYFDALAEDGIFVDGYTMSEDEDEE